LVGGEAADAGPNAAFGMKLVAAIEYAVVRRAKPCYQTFASPKFDIAAIHKHLGFGNSDVIAICLDDARGR